MAESTEVEIPGESWWTVWGATVTSLILLTLGPLVLGVVLAQTKIDVAMAILFGLLTVGGIFLTAISQKKSVDLVRKIEGRRAKSLTRFNDELTSVLGAFGDLLDSSRDKKANEQFFKAALREGKNFVSHEGTRVCVYILDLVEVEEEESDKHLLRLQAFAGRGDYPRNEFRDDTAHGAGVINIAQGNTAVCISDPQDFPDFKVDHSENSVWSSTMLIPLRDEERSYGVMMIDTRKETVFTDEDISVGWTLAKILVFGLRVVDYGKKANSASELDEAFARTNPAWLKKQIDAMLAGGAEGENGHNS